MQRILQISGIGMAINSEGHPWRLEGSYPLFEVSQGPTDVRIRVHWDCPGSTDLGEQVFQISNVPSVTGPALFPEVCRIFRDRRGQYGFETIDSNHPVFSRRVAAFDPDLSQGDLYVELAQGELPIYPNPLIPLLDRVLLATLLAQRIAILVHACGVLLDGRSYVFLGPSGAGKTTLAELWATFDDVEVLGDENLILRKNGTETWAYGSPWAKQRSLCSPQGAPVAGILFIRHALENTLTPLSMNRAMELVLRRTSLLVYDPSAVRNQLDLCSALVSATPAYEFGFVPDATAVEAVRRAAL